MSCWFGTCDRARTLGLLSTIAFFLALVICPSPAFSTGSLRQRRRNGERSIGLRIAWRNGHDHERRSKDGGHRLHERVGTVREGSSAARQVPGRRRDLWIQARGVPRHSGERRYANYARRSAAGGRSRGVRDRRRILSAAQDRSRRRGDQIRSTSAHRAAGARSQLHKVRIAHAGHAATAVEPRRERKSAGLDPDDGEWSAFQRDHVSAGRHGESRSDPRHHRHQPEPRVDRRNQDHVAELRRRVRAGNGRRRVGADQVGQQSVPR